MREIVNSLWIGPQLSLMEQLSVTSFLQNGYEYHLYGYGKIARVPPGAILREAAEILPASQIFYYQHGAGKGAVSAFANLFRYKLLLERGGWWVDTDVVCLRRFDFEEPVVIAGERTWKETRATNLVLKFPRGHEAVRRCYEAARREDPAQLRWGKTGPVLLERIVRENGLLPFVKTPGVFCPLDFWDWRLLLAENSNLLERLVTGETRAIHLWHEMWRRAGIRLDAQTGRIRPGTLEKIQRTLGLKPKPAPDSSTPFIELLRRFGLVGNPQRTPAPASNG
jgi:hypothetical protein